ncbi:LLM class F420-dependent oxidoreductase [Amycolatopsis acidiphila]|nr:LLM class F420-dependent oxidoreductase [Amycolatopsis acidiphila]
MGKCTKAEDLGYDVLSVADHLGNPAPFSALVAAAEATTHPRLATAVLNAGFYNPTLLARDVATADQLTGGRLELGLGAGYVKSEFDEAGLPFLRAKERVDHLDRMTTRLRELFSDPGYKPRPVQPSGPPLWLAGHGNRILTMAAQKADIVGFTGFTTSRDGSSSYLDNLDAVTERVLFARGLLGERLAKVELNILVWRVLITEDRVEEARRLEPLRSLSADEMLRVPSVLIGTPKEIAEQLLEHRERLGITYVTVVERSMAAFAAVIELLK